MTTPFDWVAHWRSLVEDREAQAKRLREEAGLTPGEFWEGRAEAFRRSTQSRADEADPLTELVRPRLTPDSTLLDVGAGVGRHSLGFAKTIRAVTAVEPNDSMRSLMEADAAEQGLTNLKIAAGRWEDAEVDPCDIAICSHVVYTVADIDLFLQKLHSHAREYCFVVVRTVERQVFLRGLWKQAHGEEWVREPVASDLFNVIHQSLNVIPNVEVVPFRVGRSSLASFASFDEALTSVRNELYLAPRDPRESLIREHLQSNLIEREGRWVLPSRSVGAAILWWSTEPESWNRVS